MITVFGMITILRQPQFFRFIQNSRFIERFNDGTDQCRGGYQPPAKVSILQAFS